MQKQNNPRQQLNSCQLDAKQKQLRYQQKQMHGRFSNQRQQIKTQNNIEAQYVNKQSHPEQRVKIESKKNIIKQFQKQSVQSFNQDHTPSKQPQPVNQVPNQIQGKKLVGEAKSFNMKIRVEKNQDKQEKCSIGQQIQNFNLNEWQLQKNKALLYHIIQLKQYSPKKYKLYKSILVKKLDQFLDLTLRLSEHFQIKSFRGHEQTQKKIDFLQKNIEIIFKIKIQYDQIFQKQLFQQFYTKLIFNRQIFKQLLNKQIKFLNQLQNKLKNVFQDKNNTIQKYQIHKISRQILQILQNLKFSIQMQKKIQKIQSYLPQKHKLQMNSQNYNYHRYHNSISDMIQPYYQEIFCYKIKNFNSMEWSDFDSYFLQLIQVLKQTQKLKICQKLIHYLNIETQYNNANIFISNLIIQINTFIKISLKQEINNLFKRNYDQRMDYINKILIIQKIQDFVNKIYQITGKCQQLKLSLMQYQISQVRQFFIKKFAQACLISSNYFNLSYFRKIKTINQIKKYLEKCGTDSNNQYFKTKLSITNFKVSQQTQNKFINKLIQIGFVITNFKDFSNIITLQFDKLLGLLNKLKQKQFQQFMEHINQEILKKQQKNLIFQSFPIFKQFHLNKRRQTINNLQQFEQKKHINVIVQQKIQQQYSKILENIFQQPESIDLELKKFDDQESILNLDIIHKNINPQLKIKKIKNIHVLIEDMKQKIQMVPNIINESVLTNLKSDKLNNQIENDLKNLMQKFETFSTQMWNNITKIQNLMKNEIQFQTNNNIIIRNHWKCDMSQVDSISIILTQLKQSNGVNYQKHNNKSNHHTQITNSLQKQNGLILQEQKKNELKFNFQKEDSDLNQQDSQKKSLEYQELEHQNTQLDSVVFYQQEKIYLNPN